MKPKHVYVTYIQTDIDSLWAALTEPDLTEKYFHNTRFISDMSVGGKVSYDFDGTAVIVGEILEIMPKTRLVYTFKFEKTSGDETTNDPVSRVIYELEKTENAVKFTLIHGGFENENNTFNSVGDGWPLIISGLKTLLETQNQLKL